MYWDSVNHIWVPFDVNHLARRRERREEEITYVNLQRTGYADCHHWAGQNTSIVEHSSSNYGPSTTLGHYSSIDMGSEVFLQFGYASVWAAKQLISSDLWSADNMAFAMFQMQPKIRQRLSLGNFLYELRDFRRMFQFWFARRGLLRNIANGILNYKFGWKPFLSDVVAMLNGLLSFHRELKKLIAELGTVVDRHWRFRVRDAGYVLEQVFDYDPGNPLPVYQAVPDETERSWLSEHGFIPIPYYLYGYKRRFVLEKAQWANYAMRCSYVSPTLHSVFNEAWAFLDAFGVNWDPAVIWNAIPFSFVVDWFFDVGLWMSRQWAVP